MHGIRKVLVGGPVSLVCAHSSRDGWLHQQHLYQAHGNSLQGLAGSDEQVVDQACPVIQSLCGPTLGSQDKSDSLQAAERGVKRIRVHTLTDGRDCEDGTSVPLMETLCKDLQALSEKGVDAKVASRRRTHVHHHGQI